MLQCSYITHIGAYVGAKSCKISHFNFKRMLLPTTILLWILVTLVEATPPACFLSCTNEIAALCDSHHMGFRCICANETKLVACLVDICPYGNFESARDHYLGTCMEHGMATKSNPFPPPALIPSTFRKPGILKTANLNQKPNTQEKEVIDSNNKPTAMPSTSENLQKTNFRKLQDLRLDKQNVRITRREHLKRQLKALK